MLTQTGFRINTYVDETYGFPSNAIDSISGLMIGEIQIDSDIPIGTYGDIYIKPAFFLSIGDNTLTNTSAINQPYYYYSYNVSTVLGTPYDVPISGIEFNKCKMKVTLSNNAGNVKITVNLWWQMTEDNNSYLTNVVQTIRQLSYNNSVNSLKFDNSGQSVYSAAKDMVCAIWFVETTTNTNHFIKANYQNSVNTLGAPAFKHGFYNPTTGVDGSVYNGSIVVKRGGNPYSYFNVGVSNIEFNFTRADTTALTYIIVQIINESELYQSNVTYSQNLKQICLGSTADPVPNFAQIPNFEYLDTQINPLSNAVYANAYTSSVGITSDQITFDLDASLLDPNSTYRIIVNIYCHGAAMTENGYSFVSDAITIKTYPEHDGRPQIKFAWLSETNFLGAKSITSLHDKFGFKLELNPSIGANGYNIVTGKDFYKEVKIIQIKMYYEELGFRHIVYSKEYNNSNVGNLPAIFLGTELPDFTSGVLAQSKFDTLYFQNSAPFDWFLYQQFRIRYESHIKNIQTIDLSNNTILNIPTGNQNWEGKTIILEITHITRSNEIYTFNAELEIRTNDLTLEAQNSSFLPLTQYCDPMTLQILATASFTVSPPPLWSLDVKTYNHSSARYSNVNVLVVGAPLPYILADSDPIFTAQSSGLLDERASINSTDLNVGIQYRVNAVLRDMSGGVIDLNYIEDQGTFNYFTNGLSFIFDNNSIVTDSGSHSGSVELPLKTICNNSGLLTNPCDLWNFSHSNSDSDYGIPLCVESYIEKTKEICEPILPVCNVVFDNMTFQLIRGDLEVTTSFLSIIGIVNYDLYVRDSLSAWNMIQSNGTPSLVNMFDYDYPIPDLYFFKIIWYDECGNFQESPEFSYEI